VCLFAPDSFAMRVASSDADVCDDEGDSPPLC